MGIGVGLVLITPLGESHPDFGGVIALLIFILMLVGATYMASRRIVRSVAARWTLARIVEALEIVAPLVREPSALT